MKAAAGVTLAGVDLVVGPAVAGAADAGPGAGGNVNEGATGEGASSEEDHHASLRHERITMFDERCVGSVLVGSHGTKSSSHARCESWDESQDGCSETESAVNSWIRNEVAPRGATNCQRVSWLACGLACPVRASTLGGRLAEGAAPRRACV
eukprot:2829252-Pleurochrysis_carterae.AAC.1